MTNSMSVDRLVRFHLPTADFLSARAHHGVDYLDVSGNTAYAIIVRCDVDLHNWSVKKSPGEENNTSLFMVGLMLMNGQ